MALAGDNLKDCSWKLRPSAFQKSTICFAPKIAKCRISIVFKIKLFKFPRNNAKFQYFISNTFLGSRRSHFDFETCVIIFSKLATKVSLMQMEWKLELGKFLLFLDNNRRTMGWMENKRNTVLLSLFHSFYFIFSYNMTAYNISVKNGDSWIKISIVICD